MSKIEPYYKPEIDEFHNGFEYEFHGMTSGGMMFPDDRSKNIPPSIKHWAKEICIDKMSDKFFDIGYRPINDIRELLESDQIRVKHLDREDIESFGFNDFKRAVMDWYKFPFQVECPISHYMYRGIRLQHDRDSGGIVIKGYEYEHLMEQNKESDNLYRGIIKNKSEFRKLLLRLNMIFEK